MYSENRPTLKLAQDSRKTVAVIVAHPDDETLWAGGTILSHPLWQCFVVCLCRGDDDERSPKFYEALRILKADGNMGVMDDGPEQFPLPKEEAESTIVNLLPERHYDLVITHNTTGEYTEHLRHRETSNAVLALWKAGKISASELWTFAYEDGDKAYFPRSIEHADICRTLTKHIWQRKYNIITSTYGFGPESWEASTTPKKEAFWIFNESNRAK